MTHALGSTLTSLVGSYGLIAVFVLMALESCGLPVPSEVVMPAAGLLAAGGQMNLGAAVLAGALGNLAGSLAAYGLAARFGKPLLLGPGRYLGISRHHVAMADGWFARYGLAAVLAGRVLPVVRTYISFPAGLARVRLLPFSVLTVVGALPWCLALAAAGFALRSNYTRVTASIDKAALVMALVVAVIVVAWILRGRRTHAREIG